MCGEKAVETILWYSWMGSPPHVRGKGRIWHGRLDGSRITPACAGKSGSIGAESENRRDHPRMCGEKFAHVVDSIRPAGSPPHVRGKGPALVLAIVEFGITPACAGKRKNLDVRTGRKKDHPRMCGEKILHNLFVIGSGGSPPHVRGKGSRPTMSSRPVWITPACAGKRVFLVSAISVPPDHPRMCGEKLYFLSGNGITLGSPPHVRGKEAASFWTSTSLGITPACAGKRARAVQRIPDAQDHPRMCGEKTKKIP